MPLDRSRPGSADAGLTAAADYLDRPGRSVWIFPQGRQRPAWLRPLDLKRGVQRIGQRAGAPIVPVSIQYGFREHAVPSAVFDFGPPLPSTAPVDVLEAALCAGLDRIDDFFTGDGARFSPLLAPRTGRSEDGIGSRLLTMTRRTT